MNDIWKQYECGTLVDRQLKVLGAQGLLISEEFSESCVKQACYELRAGNVYYDVYDSDEPIDVDKYGYILLKPKQCVAVITKEKLALPACVLGRILTKGKLFSIGISAVNTYADPGFCGRLGIVLMNLSNKYIKIKPGEPIAKIEFSILKNDVESPYSGQHGYETEIWPIPKGMTLTEDEIKQDPRIKSEVDEVSQSFGGSIGRHYKRVLKVEKWTLSVGLLSFIFYFLVIVMLDYLKSSHSTFSWFFAIGTSVCGGVITLILTFVANSIPKRRSKS